MQLVIHFRELSQQLPQQRTTASLMHDSVCRKSTAATPTAIAAAAAASEWKGRTLWKNKERIAREKAKKKK